MLSHQMLSFNSFVKLGRGEKYRILYDERDEAIEVSNQEFDVLSACLEAIILQTHIETAPKRIAPSREHWDNKLGDTISIPGCCCPYCLLSPAKRPSNFSVASPLEWVTSRRRRSRPFLCNTSSGDANSFFSKFVRTKSESRSSSPMLLKSSREDGFSEDGIDSYFDFKKSYKPFPPVADPLPFDSDINDSEVNICARDWSG